MPFGSLSHRLRAFSSFLVSVDVSLSPSLLLSASGAAPHTQTHRSVFAHPFVWFLLFPSTSIALDLLSILARVPFLAPSSLLRFLCFFFPLPYWIVIFSFFFSPPLSQDISDSHTRPQQKKKKTSKKLREVNVTHRPSSVACAQTSTSFRVDSPFNFLLAGPCKFI